MKKGGKINMHSIKISFENGKITIEQDQPSKTNREKGKSLIDFPRNYTVIDIETTGYDYKYDSIIEVAALRYRDNILVDTYTSLIQPNSVYEFDREVDIDYCVVDNKKVQFIDDSIVQLTGITNDMLKVAPKESAVIRNFIEFIKDDVLIGHNVNFDINFLYDASIAHLGYKLSNNFIDTLRISRKLFPEFKHHRLRDLCNYYGLDHSGAHRSVHDCTVTNSVYQKMQTNIIDKFDTLNDFKKAFKKKGTGNKLDARDIKPSIEIMINEDHPFYEKTFVFTGVLDRMKRKDAMQLVVNLGGIVGNGVTKQTNYLVLGCNDYCSTIKDGKSTKQKKAEKLKLSGEDIEIISENVFYDMLEM